MREIVIDTETSGLGSDARILEIACVEINNGQPTGRMFCSLVWPGAETVISDSAAAVHGLTLDKLRGAPTFGQLFVSIKSFLWEARLFAYNAEFDMRMLQQEVARLPDVKSNFSFGAPPPSCILALARQKLPGPHKLGDVVTRLGLDAQVERFPAHSALGDALRAAAVYRALAHEGS
jgi:DNA polymerase III subunit epsilon